MSRVATPQRAERCCRCPTQSRRRAAPGRSGAAPPSDTPAGGPAEGGTAVAELYGPVVLQHGATAPLRRFFFMGSNNTGELSGVAEALLWVRDFAPRKYKRAPLPLHAMWTADN